MRLRSSKALSTCAARSSPWWVCDAGLACRWLTTRAQAASSSSKLAIRWWELSWTASAKCCASTTRRSSRRAPSWLASIPTTCTALPSCPSNWSSCLTWTGYLSVTSAAPSKSPRPSHLAVDDVVESQLELELVRNRVVVQLAGAVAHKLKQPLAVAWGYLELLLDDPNLALAPSTVRYLREIQDSLHTMDEVIIKLQQATTHQTRPYAGGSEILDLE